MSKNKKNKKNSWKYFGGEYDKKKSKKGKKNKRSVYDKPKMKTVKPTLSKKDAKANKKVVLSPVEVPKEFRKNRLKCNHAVRMITPEAYRNMTPTYAAYTPALERVVEKYGKDHVHVCKDCYDVLVDRNMITSDEVYDAMTTLYVACNVAVANKRLKDDEVKAIAKLKDVVEDFRPVLDILEKIEEEGTESAQPTNTASLNSNSGAVFVDPDDD